MEQPTPDHIYLVETDTDCWIVWVIKEEDRWLDDVSDSGPHEIEVSTLGRLFMADYHDASNPGHVDRG